jgi:outer membrane lipoprotein-sorting protein
MKTFLSLFFIVLSTVSSAQDANALLNKVISKLNSVEDYTVQANIKADIPMIKILPSQAKIYFKQKDKFKVESKGISILPKQGFSEMNSFLNNKKGYVAVAGEQTMVDGIKTQLVTVIPNDETSDMILAKLWIDTKRSVIMKSQLTTKSNGTVSSTYSYGSEVNYGLPSKLVFEIDVKKFKLPKSVAADINKTSSKEPKKQKEKGTITITLTDYKINQGLSDNLFKSTANKKKN